MKTLQLTLIAIFAVCFSSCGDNKAADDVAESMVENFNKIPDVIKDVNDVESAKAASDKLRQIGKDINAVIIANKDAKISKSKSAEMQSTMKTQVEKATELIKAKITKLSAEDPAAAAELTKGFQDLFTNLSNGI